MSTPAPPNLIATLRPQIADLEAWVRVIIAARALARAVPLALPPPVPGQTLAEGDSLGLRPGIRLAARRTVAQALIAVEHHGRLAANADLTDLRAVAQRLDDRPAIEIADAALALIGTASTACAVADFGTGDDRCTHFAAVTVEHAWWALRTASAPDQLWADALRVDLAAARVEPAPGTNPPSLLARFGPLQPGRAIIGRPAAPTTAGGLRQSRQKPIDPC